MAIAKLDVPPEIHKATTSITMASGVTGLVTALLLGLLQWRIIWSTNHGTTFMDWSPYPEYLALSLNWWVPISLTIVGASVYLTTHTKRSSILKIGLGLNGVSCVGLMGLALWVFTVLLPGGYEMVWWLHWAG